MKLLEASKQLENQRIKKPQIEPKNPRIRISQTRNRTMKLTTYLDSLQPDEAIQLIKTCERSQNQKALILTKNPNSPESKKN